MKNKIYKVSPDDFPELLKEIPDKPKLLYAEGNLKVEKNTKFLAVVGSRRFSNYGKSVCKDIIGGLAGSDIIIVSGLALGIDAVAHKTAIENGLRTFAIPGSGLDESVLYPATNINLANDILKNDGALISELEPKTTATIYTFPKRNRIMAGMSHATLVIEAGEKSGTLITARLALDYNRDVLAVPGSIYSPTSKGVNYLIRQGATLVTSAEDVLDSLGIKTKTIKPSERKDLSEQEKKILYLITEEPLPKDELIRLLNIPTGEINSLLSLMEIKGIIKESMGVIMPI
ncbi:MAG: DNA-processing protein DprA [Candidatus Paceibacterota bacterium]